MTKLISVVRETATDMIVDALMLEGIKGYGQNPTIELSRKWPPFKYYIESVTTDNPFRYFNGEEVRTIDELTIAKVLGLSTGIKVPAKRNICSIGDEISIQTRKEEIQLYFEKYGTDVSIVAGEAYYKIYDMDLYNAIQKSVTLNATPKSNIKFIVGPLVVVADASRRNRVGDSIIPRLQSTENVELYCSGSRQSLHFWIGANKILQFEEYHGPLAQQRVSWVFEKDSYMIKKFKAIFNLMCRSENVTRSTDAEKDFIYLTHSQFNRLKTVCEQEALEGGPSYRDCTKGHFLDLIEKYNINDI